MEMQLQAQHSDHSAKTTPHIERASSSSPRRYTMGLDEDIAAHAAGEEVGGAAAQQEEPLVRPQHSARPLPLRRFPSGTGAAPPLSC